MRAFARAIATASLGLAVLACGAGPGSSLGPTRRPDRSPVPTMAPTPTPTVDTESALDAEIAAQREIWQALGIDDYSFEITRSCFCPPQSIGPFLVTVEDGVATSVLFEGAAADEQFTTGLPRTIDDVFQRLLDLEDAAEVVVAWDAEHGFPSHADVDPIPNAIDDEFSLLVTSFTPAG